MTDAPAPLYSPSAVRALLKRHGLRPDKAFGQNFLVDGNVLAAIVEAADPTPNDTVLEVGPGLGVLTRSLASRAGRVESVELDRRLLPALEETVGGLANVSVTPGDALEYDFMQLPEGSLLVANLPYNVATPIIVRSLESGRFKRLVAMVQKEVAERLAAAPGGEAYGALSLVVQHFARVEKLRNVKPSSFFPPPEVTSSLVRIETRPEATLEPELFALVRDAFRHRRKTLKKNLLMAGYARERVEAALGGLQLDPRVRAEALGLDAFRALQQRLGPRGQP